MALSEVKINNLKKTKKGIVYSSIINQFNRTVNKVKKMIKSCVEEINKQGATYKKHSNQWNVMQQLIDIVTDNPDISEIVYQDLQIDEMKLEKLISKITGKRLADPEKVMKAICDFYKIPCPDYLPPEVWRSTIEVHDAPKSVKPAPSVIDLLDFV